MYYYIIVAIVILLIVIGLVSWVIFFKKTNSSHDSSSSLPSSPSNPSNPSIPQPPPQVPTSIMKPLLNEIKQTNTIPLLTENINMMLTLNNRTMQNYVTAEKLYSASQSTTFTPTFASTNIIPIANLSTDLKKTFTINGIFIPLMIFSDGKKSTDVYDNILNYIYFNITLNAFEGGSMKNYQLTFPVSAIQSMKGVKVTEYGVWYPMSGILPNQLSFISLSLEFKGDTKVLVFDNTKVSPFFITGF